MSQKRAARMNKGNGGKKLTADKRKSFQRESLKWCLSWGNRGKNIV